MTSEPGWIRRSWRSDEGRLAWLSAFASLLVGIGAIYAGVVIPQNIDADAQKRQIYQNCENALLELRSNALELNSDLDALGAGGYPDARGTWDAVAASIDQVSLLCDQVPSDDLTLDSNNVFVLFQSAREEAEAGRWTSTNAGEIATLTERVIGDISVG